MFKRNLVFYQHSDGGGAGADAGTNEGGADVPNFDAFIAKQPPEIKALFDDHTKNLKTALDSKRGTRKDLEKQLRELATKSEKGSDAESKLIEMADQMAATDRKASFYEQAHAAGVKNLKLAYLAATTDDLFDKKGNVDFVSMKTNYPELFGVKKIANGNAGDGTEDDNPNGAVDMNQRIRRQSGRANQ